MDPLGEGLEMRGDAGDGAVGKAPAAVRLEFLLEGIQKRPRQAAGPQRAVIAPLLRLHKGEEAPEVAALHRPRALRSGHLHGEVGFEPRGQGVRAVGEIEAHRQADLSGS